MTSLPSHFPRMNTASVTAGLKCAPETCPPAKIMTINEAPMAIGARAAPPRTVMPTVKTRKKVPMNSTRYFFMGIGVRHEFQRIRTYLSRSEREVGEDIDRWIFGQTLCNQKGPRNTRRRETNRL